MKTLPEIFKCIQYLKRQCLNAYPHPCLGQRVLLWLSSIHLSVCLSDNCTAQQIITFHGGDLYLVLLLSSYKLELWRLWLGYGNFCLFCDTSHFFLIFILQQHWFSTNHNISWSWCIFHSNCPCHEPKWCWLWLSWDNCCIFCGTSWEFGVIFGSLAGPWWHYHLTEHSISGV